MIERVGVVIPARDEQRLLPACLDAIARASTLVDVPVHVVVVLDACVDGSRAIVSARPGVTIVEVDAHSVGVARRAGAAEVLRWASGVAAERIWLATTDADSVVPPDWLCGQLALAGAGWEVVVGTVTVADWSEHTAATEPLWMHKYHAIEDHQHVHGANLGCSAAAYLDSGGWSPVAADEDVALVAALAHRRVLRTATLPVVTSARRDPRAIGGFGDTLRELVR